LFIGTEKKRDYMSARDGFFKKVQENQDNQQNLISRVQADVMSFRAAMFELTKQVEQWLHGSGVEVATTEKLFNDESVSFIQGCEDLSTYKISSCRIKNGPKTAVIEPAAAYGGKATKGWASLTIDTPNRAPRIQKFLLRLGEDGTWTIRNDDMPSNMHDPLIKQEFALTEETFFQAIESLA